MGKNKIRAFEVSHANLPPVQIGNLLDLCDSPQNLSSFSNLKILSIQSNRITKMENLEGLVSLEELYLSHNGLSKIEGLEKNVSVSCACKPACLHHLTYLSRFT